MKLKNIFFLVLLAIGAGGCLDDVEDTNAQLNTEIAAIDAYLTQMGLSDRALYDNETGIRFVIHSHGQEAPPHEGQTVKATYRQTQLANQSQFASGSISDVWEKVAPQGLRYCVGSLMTGSTATVFIPSKYCYGETGNTTLGIPANATLVYEITLEDVELTAAQKERFAIDTAAIGNYIRNNGIDATQHVAPDSGEPTGIWYSIEEAGTGNYPNVYGHVAFDYKLKLLSNPGSIVQENTLSNQSVFGLIDGLKIGLPRIAQGTKATFYIPSVLAYGTNGSGSIPANANLIFEVKLTTVAQ